MKGHLGSGGVVLPDEGPLIAVQTVADFESLHEDVAVAVFPALDHHTTHHLILAQIHLWRSYRVISFRKKEENVTRKVRF